MRRFIAPFVFITVFLLSLPASAQQKDFSVLITGGYSQPLGKFGELIGKSPDLTRRFGFDFGEEVGLASPGLGLGIELWNKVFDGNYDWIFEVKFMANWSNVDKISSYFKHDLGDTVNVSFDYGTWINIPVFTGLAYSFPFSESFKMQLLGLGGINITRQATRTVSVDGVKVEDTEFKFTPDFGFELGVGVEYENKYNLSIRYVNLSSPRYEGTRTLNENFFKSIPKRVSNVDGDERPVTMIFLTLGYRL